ncbi:MAG: TnpV protein [Clostridia bacterium]|nr:TnpV protein [Clostridia bacterium]
MHNYDNKRLPAVIQDTENGITYILNGDYYFPLLCDEEDDEPLGRWGWIRMQHLMENHPGRYSYLLLSGQLFPHLREVEEQAERRFDVLMAQFKVALGITEKLKAADQLRWVQLMNSARHDVEEIIMDELIYDEGGAVHG